MLVNLNEVLLKAQREHCGVGLFKTIDTDMLQAVIDAAEANQSPVIIGTAELLLPYGELKLITPALRDAAERASGSALRPRSDLRALHGGSGSGLLQRHVRRLRRRDLQEPGGHRRGSPHCPCLRRHR